MSIGARFLPAAGVLVALSCGQAGAQDQPPSAVPPNFSASTPSIGFSSPSIGFSTPSIGFNSPSIGFTSPTMTEEELAFAPKPPASPMPAVEGLAVTEEAGGVRYTLSADILFDFDKATLRPKAATALKAMSADVRRRFSDPLFVVDGYTDSKGSDAYNMKLSVRRADAVKAFLTEKEAFSSDAVETEGRGEANPVAPNETPSGEDDPEGRQKNRRVEILVKQQS